MLWFFFNTPSCANQELFIAKQRFLHTRWFIIRFSRCVISHIPMGLSAYGGTNPARPSLLLTNDRFPINHQLLYRDRMSF
jgi:hypothetical protein